MENKLFRFRFHEDRYIITNSVLSLNYQTVPIMPGHKILSSWLHILQDCPRVNVVLCPGVQITDILSGGPHESPGNKHGVLAAVQRARGPVQRRVVVAGADRLVDRRHHVIVLFALSVVEHVRALQHHSVLSHVQPKSVQISKYYIPNSVRSETI